MPTPTLTTMPVLHDATPVGTDFAGGAEALPVRPATPGPVVLGSDFAGGAMLLTGQVGPDEPDQDRGPS
jgi:hypothetical protein